MSDKTWWYLCDTCAVPHYGVGRMLFGCEATNMSVKPSTSGRVEPTKLCKHYVSQQVMYSKPHIIDGPGEQS